MAVERVAFPPHSTSGSVVSDEALLEEDRQTRERERDREEGRGDRSVDRERVRVARRVCEPLGERCPVASTSVTPMIDAIVVFWITLAPDLDVETAKAPASTRPL